MIQHKETAWKETGLWFGVLGRVIAIVLIIMCNTRQWKENYDSDYQTTKSLTLRDWIDYIVIYKQFLVYELSLCKTIEEIAK